VSRQLRKLSLAKPEQLPVTQVPQKEVILPLPPGRNGTLIAYKHIFLSMAAYLPGPGIMSGNVTETNNKRKAVVKPPNLHGVKPATGLTINVFTVRCGLNIFFSFCRCADITVPPAAFRVM